MEKFNCTECNCVWDKTFKMKNANSEPKFAKPTAQEVKSGGNCPECGSDEVEKFTQRVE